MLRDHILVKVLMLVFKNHMFYGHQRMTFEFGVILVLCKHVSGEHSVHILIFLLILLFQNTLCDKKSLGFVIDVDKNLAVAFRFDGFV